MAAEVANPYDTQQAQTGIIGGKIENQALPSSGSSDQYNPTAGMKFQSWTPQTREVNQATDTAQGQLASILATDNPLMQRARTIATQQANARGLANSSMAVEAGTSAMIGNAMPIAQQDANTYDSRAKANMDATNQAGVFNVGQNNQLVSSGMSIAAAMQQQKDQQQFQSGQSELDRAQQTNLQAAQQQFQAGQSALDRAQQTNLQTGQQQFQAGQAALDRQTQVQLQQQQVDLTTAQNALNRAQEAFMADKSAANQQALQTAQQQFQAAQAALDRTQQTQTQQAQIQAAQTLQDTQQQFQATQALLSFDQQKELAKLQYSLNSSSTSTAFAASIATGTLNSINAIQADGNLTPDAKRAAIANVLATSNSTMQWASTFYGTNLPTIAAPGTTPTVVTPTANLNNASPTTTASPGAPSSPTSSVPSSPTPPAPSPPTTPQPTGSTPPAGTVLAPTPDKFQQTPTGYVAGAGTKEQQYNNAVAIWRAKYTDANGVVNAPANADPFPELASFVPPMTWVPYKSAGRGGMPASGGYYVDPDGVRYDVNKNPIPSTDKAPK